MTIRQRYSMSRSVCLPMSRRPLHVLAAASLLLATFGATSGELVRGGFEIHRQGSSPFAREWSANLVSATEARCAQFAELCGMVTATQGGAQGAECLARMRVEPFNIIGNPDTNGDFEVIEYHHPGLQKSSVTKRSTRLLQTSTCQLEVLQDEKTTITHYNPRGRKVFTRVINPQRGVQPWRTTTHPRLDTESIDLLRQALSLKAFVPAELNAGNVSVATAPGLSDDHIADKRCRWVTLTPPPMEGRLCLLTQGIGMPINESLSAEILGEGVSGPVVILRDEVVLFKGPVDLPAAVFEADEAATDTTREYTATATDAWCEREATRTGIDPCQEDAHAYPDD